MSSIIFKQNYKARDSPGVAGLNVRHLQYIATRPGAVYNRGCGFGLWGQLPGNDAIRIQNDLTLTKRVVREASKDHTLYRAIISVGKKDAEEHGLYRRERWERLVNDHIGVIAKEMDIKPENFCWCASMHRSKGHPHVHILYWDNSNQPRDEAIPKHLFNEKAERIRAEFAGDIFREQILDAQQEQRQQSRSLRTALQAMCQEANPEKALDLPKLYKSELLDGLSQRMASLIQHLPTKGSLRYAYLPAGYKEMVNSFIDDCLKQPELAKEAHRYDALTQKISRLYANGETGTAENLETARKKLYKELGNEVMDALRGIRAEIAGDAPEDRRTARMLIHEAVNNVAPSLYSYRYLLALMPTERIPTSCMERQIPGFHDQMNKVLNDVISDARVRLRLQKYALKTAGIDLEQKPNIPKREAGTQAEASKHILNGKELSEQEWAAYQDIYEEAKRDLRMEIRDKLRQDAGWTDEAMRTGTAMAMCSMMCVISRLANQRKAMVSQAGLSKLLSKDKSREARKDAQAKQALGSEWGNEY